MSSHTATPHVRRFLRSHAFLRRVPQTVPENHRQNGAQARGHGGTTTRYAPTCTVRLVLPAYRSSAPVQRPHEYGRGGCADALRGKKNRPARAAFCVVTGVNIPSRQTRSSRASASLPLPLFFLLVAGARHRSRVASNASGTRLRTRRARRPACACDPCFCAE